MPVRLVKNQHKRNKWDFFNVPIVKRWFRLFLPLHYL